MKVYRNNTSMKKILPRFYFLAAAIDTCCCLMKNLIDKKYIYCEKIQFLKNIIELGKYYFCRLKWITCHHIAVAPDLIKRLYRNLKLKRTFERFKWRRSISK